MLRDRSTTVSNLVLSPERLSIEETQSAITGLDRLGIPVRALVINQCILPEVIEGNRFLAGVSVEVGADMGVAATSGAVGAGVRVAVPMAVALGKVW